MLNLTVFSLLSFFFSFIFSLFSLSHTLAAAVREAAEARLHELLVDRAEPLQARELTREATREATREFYP